MNNNSFGLLLDNPEYFFINLIIQGVGLLSALKSVTSKNPVSSILWLIVVFLSFSCVMIYLGAEFLGLVFLVVYVGAIAVLFLFVVMMLNVRVIELNSKFLSYFPIAGFAIATVLVLLSSFIYPGFSSFYNNLYSNDWILNLNSLNNIESIGHSLYNYFFPLFLIASMILLVAMIGSIMLTLQNKSEVKRQLISVQLSHNFNSQLDLRS